MLSFLPILCTKNEYNKSYAYKKMFDLFLFSLTLLLVSVCFTWTKRESWLPNIPIAGSRKKIMIRGEKVDQSCSCKHRSHGSCVRSDRQRWTSVAGGFTLDTFMVRQPRKKVAEERDDDRVVKPAKKRTAPTNTSLLPPCKVCLEPAAGFHYGANTCEACKGFFRRTLVRQGSYECINGDEKCTVVLAELKSKKRRCSRCRHLKCLAVGMSLHAVKTGRYTHTKRTQDILEYKQVMGQSSHSVTCLSVSTVSGATPNSASTSASSFHTSFSANNPSQPVATSFEFASTISGPVPGSATLPSQQCDYSLQYTTLTPTPFSSLQTSSVWSLSHANSHHFENDPEVCLYSLPRLQSLLSTSSYVNNVLDCMVETEGGRCDGAISVSSQDSSSTSSSMSVSFGEPVATQSMDVVGGGDLSDEECKKLTQHILKSYADSNFAKYALSAEEILERQRACYENFQARIEVFGPMENLSEEEYQEVYQSTGIDVDNRQTFISTVSKVMEESIHEYIRFVKGIPGFSQLCLNDKTTLIRDNRAEVMAISQTMGYNHELQVFTLPSGRTFSMHDMSKIGGKERQKIRVNVCTPSRGWS
ncbi:uncharacterized protein LOC143286818 isoform X2 [Babylonia areolata]|uniref:uncharacterized protein LOC143286818 isoform X2 n=1 Tax=Babylonia areolata TaxID=304850 RepID=UPI003FD2BCCA